MRRDAAGKQRVGQKHPVCNLGRLVRSGRARVSKLDQRQRSFPIRIMPARTADMPDRLGCDSAALGDRQKRQYALFATVDRECRAAVTIRAARRHNGSGAEDDTRLGEGQRGLDREQEGALLPSFA